MNDDREGAGATEVGAAEGSAVRANAFWPRALGALVLSVLANLVVWWLGTTFVDVPADFPPLDGPGPTIFFTSVGAVGAIVAYKLIGLRSGSPDSLFRRVALVVLVLSFVPDVLLLTAGGDAVPGATVPGVVILMTMHVVAAAVIVRLLTGSLGAPRAGASSR